VSPPVLMLMPPGLWGVEACTPAALERTLKLFAGLPLLWRHVTAAQLQELFMSKSMQHTLKAAVAALALLGTAAVSATTVSTPLNGSLINTTIMNDSGTMSMIRFDLSNTVTMDGTQVVFGGLYGDLPGFTPAGTSTYALVGAAGATVFGFDFTAFNAGQSFAFGWDPDSAKNAKYGAVPNDLVGTVVTATFDSGPNMRGVMVLDTAGNVGTTLVAVPEPQTYALMLAGLALVAGVARRRLSR